MFTGALGWNEEASQAAVRQCGGNSTQAVELLEKEEIAMLEQFESAVKDMVRFPFLVFYYYFLCSLFISVIFFHYLYCFDCSWCVFFILPMIILNVDNIENS